MSEYPEDIKEAAMKTLQKLEWGNDTKWFEIIAAALLAERKRCAEVAKTCKIVVPLASGTACGASSAASQIAEAIMKGGAA